MGFLTREIEIDATRLHDHITTDLSGNVPIPWLKPRNIMTGPFFDAGDTVYEAIANASEEAAEAETPVDVFCLLNIPGVEGVTRATPPMVLQDDVASAIKEWFDEHDPEISETGFRDVYLDGIYAKLVVGAEGDVQETRLVARYHDE